MIPLKLSHGDLAELIGNQRPSVSSRLAKLAARGRVIRRDDRSWLLVGDPPSEVRDMWARAQGSEPAAPDDDSDAADPDLAAVLD